MRLLLVVLCLLTQVNAFVVQVTNDTKQTHFLLFKKVGYLLNKGDHCTLQIPEESWWRKIAWRESIMLYRQGNDGVFSERFNIRPKGSGEDRVEISISDVHRQAQQKNTSYTVQADRINNEEQESDT